MTALAMLTVFDGRELCGFVLKRGRAGFEAFNRDEASLGIRRPPPQCGFRQCGKGLREGGLLMLEQLATDLTPPSAAVFTEAEAQRRLAEHGKASVLELARVWGWSASAVYRFLQSKAPSETPSETDGSVSGETDLVVPALPEIRCRRVLGVVEIIADDGDDVVVIAVELVPRLVAKLCAVVKEAAT
jgi:hypothetical protein